MKIALKKAYNFAFNQQLSLLEKSIYLHFQSEANNFNNKKIHIYSLRNIKNYNDISYIYKYNLVKMHNNNIQLENYINLYNFMTKKFKQYSNDIRSYKRLK